MPLSKPKYHLQNFYVDGSSEPCQVFNVADAVVTSHMSRRGFVGAGVALSAVVTAMNADSAIAADAAAKLVYAHRDQISGLIALADGGTLLSASWDGTIKSWKLPSGEFIKVAKENPNGAKDPVLAITQSFDGSLVAISTLRAVGLYNPSRLFHPLYFEDSDRITAMALLFTPRDPRLAIVYSNGTLYMVEEAVDRRPNNGANPQKGAPEKKYQTKKVKAAEIPALMEREWNISADLQRTLSDPRTGLAAFCISLDARFLAYADTKFCIRLHNTSTDKSVAELQRKQRVEMLVMNRNGRFLAALHKNKGVVVWDLEKNTESAEIVGHNAAVTAMTVTDDGKILVVGYSDGVLAFWFIENGERFAYGFDAEAGPNKGLNFRVNSLTYTQPCGTPIPANATCVCNCVPGKGPLGSRSRMPRTLEDAGRRVASTMPPIVPVPFFFPSPGGCSCVPVCTCIPVYR